MEDEQAAEDSSAAASRGDEAAMEPPPDEAEPVLQPPAQQGGRKAKYPCLSCGKNVSGASVKCTLCELWCHKACSGLPAETYKGLMVQAKEVGTAFWSCRACMGFAQKMNKLYQELNRRQDATEARVNQIDNRTANTEQAMIRLSQELKRALDKIEDDKQGNNDALCDELRERDLRKLNLVIHGLPEPDQGISFNRERVEADRRSCTDLFAAIGVRTGGGDLRFCRRIGERGRDARPIVIGLRTDEERRIILERARDLRGGRFDNVSIVPDLTRMQRRGEDRLNEEAAKRNSSLTADDLAKNLRWLVVGRRGEKRLIKGTETVQRNRAPQPRLSDFIGAANAGRGGPYGGGAQNNGAPRLTVPQPNTGPQYGGGPRYSSGQQTSSGPQYTGGPQYGGGQHFSGEQQFGGGSNYVYTQQHSGGPQHGTGAPGSGPQYGGGPQQGGTPHYNGGQQDSGPQHGGDYTYVAVSQQQQQYGPVVPMPGMQQSTHNITANHTALGARPRDTHPLTTGGGGRLLSPVRRSGEYVPEQHRRYSAEFNAGGGVPVNYTHGETDRPGQQQATPATAYADQQQRPRLGSKRGREQNATMNDGWEGRDYSPPKTRQKH
jgi:hypothetical protein